MIGKWAFIIGVLLAILAGLIPQLPAATIGWILMVLGLVVGFLNVSDKSSTAFLVAAIALLGVGAAGFAGLANVPTIGEFLGKILSNIVAFVAPAALVVSLKAVYELGSVS